MAKIDISKLSVEELVHYEEAAKKVILHYENSIKVYDGSIRLNSADYEAYEKYNKVYLKILRELENRLSEL
jgi:hypothetical protein